METLLKDAWIERCATRLVELQPLMPPRVATLAANGLWQEEHDFTPPDQRADIEVASWSAPRAQSGGVLGKRQGFRRRWVVWLFGEWRAEVAIMLFIVGMMLTPWEALWQVLSQMMKDYLH